jgi:hypothetical protein
MLARIDGKSPVEYLVGMQRLQEAARRIARDGLLTPRQRLAELAPSACGRTDLGHAH